MIAEGEGTADPKTFSFGGSNLVSDALGSDLPLKLGERQKHVEPSWPGLPCGLIFFVPEAKEARSIPFGAGDREGDLRQTVIGLAVPGKAVGHDHHPLRPASIARCGRGSLRGLGPSALRGLP